MDLLVFIKQAAEIGLTAPAIIGLGIIWQINKKFNNYDIRLSVLESQQNRRHTDN